MRIENASLPQTAEWTPERVALVGRSAALVAAGGIVIGIFAAAMQLYWVAAAIGVLLVVLVVSWQFEGALGLYALVAFVTLGQTPGLATGGSGVGKSLCISEIMLGFLLVVWFGKYVTGMLPKNRIPSGFYVPLALYVIYCFINVVSSFMFWDYHVARIYQYTSVNILELGLHILSAGALVMVATSVTNRKWLKYVTIAVLGAGIYNLGNSLTGGLVPIAARWASLLFLLPAAYALTVALDGDRTPMIRITGAVGVCMAIGLTFVRGMSWVSGWLGMFACLGTVLYIKNRKAFAVCVVVAVLCVCAAEPFLYSNVVAKSQTEGDYDRFALLAGALRYATTFPLGVGLGNYRSYNSFHYGQEWGTTAYTSAHGTYSQHLSEMGIPGLVLFVVLLAAGFRWMLVEYRKLPPGFSKTFLLAATGQMAGIAAAAIIGDYIIPTYHNGGVVNFSTTVYSWLIWGLAIAHVRISRDEANGSVDSNS